jgi:hypothetical protein
MSEFCLFLAFCLFGVREGRLFLLFLLLLLERDLRDGFLDLVLDLDLVELLLCLLMVFFKKF